MNALRKDSPHASKIGEIKILGLMAGDGRFPFLICEAAKQLGIPVHVFAVKGITSKELPPFAAKTHWMELGQFSDFIRHCHAEGVRHVVMAGRIPHNAIWRYRGFDTRSLRLLGRMVTRKADSILGTVVQELQGEGIEVIDSSLLLGGCMPAKGLLTPSRPLSAREDKDVAFGFPIARQIAGMDIGQTIVVKDLAVVAVESLEGTDEAIRRAGRIADGNIVVIKVCKPHQDSRFDIPVIGPDTVRTLRDAGGGALAVMAGETLFFDREEAVALAHEFGIGIVAF